MFNFERASHAQIEMAENFCNLLTKDWKETEDYDTECNHVILKMDVFIAKVCRVPRNDPEKVFQFSIRVSS